MISPRAPHTDACPSKPVDDPRRTPSTDPNEPQERDERNQRDEVDEASEESFPASDPPSWTQTSATPGNGEI